MPIPMLSRLFRRNKKMLPPWIRHELHAHAISPSTGMQIRIKVGGRVNYDVGKADFKSLETILLEMLNDQSGETDARVMTTEEVNAYDEDEDDEDEY